MRLRSARGSRNVAHAGDGDHQGEISQRIRVKRCRHAQAGDHEAADRGPRNAEERAAVTDSVTASGSNDLGTSRGKRAWRVAASKARIADCAAISR